MFCPKWNFHNLEGGPKGSTLTFFLGFSPMFQKEIVMGQPKWLIAKTKIEFFFFMDPPATN
jgi:hypothetical protein